MKTILLAVNSRYTHAALAPWYLKAAVREENARRIASSSATGVEASAPSLEVMEEPLIMEANINQALGDVVERILEAQPEVLGISCYIWNILWIQPFLTAFATALPSCILILGGPEVSYSSADYMGAMPMVDYIVCGEGERPFTALLSALHLHRHMGDFALQSLALEQTLAGISGLTWRKGTIVHNPISHLPQEPPDPFMPEYMEAINGRMVYVETSRGCPFQCSFCLSGSGQQLRYFDLDRAKESLLRLAHSGAKTIKLVDRTFNSDPSRSRAILHFLLSSYHQGSIPSGVCFHLEVAADLFDEESLHMLMHAPPGLFQLEIGIQSFHQHTLDLIGRKTNLARAKASIQALRLHHNIHLHLDLIAGLPGEDFATFAHSFDQAFALAPHMLQLGFLKLLHGSRLRDTCELFGIEFDPLPPYQVQQTKWLSPEDLDALHLVEATFNRLYNSGRFPCTIAFLLHATAQVDTDSSPFALFSSIGRALQPAPGMPLETWIEGLLDYSQQHLLDVDTMRDCLVIDWLQTNPVGVLPPCLQRPDPQVASVRRALERKVKQEAPTSEMGTRRPFGFGLLYGQGALFLTDNPGTMQHTPPLIAVSDYRKPKPFLGHYPLTILPLAAFL